MFMNSADGSESKLGLTSSLVDQLVPRPERQTQARLYWFQETDTEDGPTEEWSFADPGARTHALKARLQARGAADERVLLPCHGLAEAALAGGESSAVHARPALALDLSSGFRAQAGRRPDAVAVVGGHERLTYAELDARSDALAWHLREHGVGPDVRVGLAMERSAGMVVAMLGILKAGGACVPLAMDATRDARASVLEAARARVLVTRSGRDVSEPPDGVCTVFVDSEEAYELGVLGPPHAGTSPGDAASVLYSMVPHGRPRGVTVSHADMADAFLAMDSRVGSVPEGTWLTITPPARDGSLLELLWALVRGFRVVMPDA
ncbi:AMP-binding protein [Corallococcus sp. Z5C101001]|uniref:AMP-binding protein n=1 Tax=Corallococcus sp. Z5C101001 TaxID=2596829 RepID=UPI00163DB023|nr:AMP-binding protein [Corallococcus sp. Z5C101001]